MRVFVYSGSASEWSDIIKSACGKSVHVYMYCTCVCVCVCVCLCESRIGNWMVWRTQFLKIPPALLPVSPLTTGIKTEDGKGKGGGTVTAMVVMKERMVRETEG